MLHHRSDIIAITIELYPPPVKSCWCAGGTIAIGIPSDGVILERSQINGIATQALHLKSPINQIVRNTKYPSTYLTNTLKAIGEKEGKDAA